MRPRNPQPSTSRSAMSAGEARHSPANPPSGPMPRKSEERGLSSFRKAKESVPDSNAYVSAETKEQWAGEHVPLFLHSAIREETGGFGGKPRWVLAISDREPGNTTALLTLQANNYRDSLFGGEIQDELAQGYIGPLMLTVFEMRSGQQAWELAEWEPF